MTLEFDIRRTIILSSYMKHWGMPEYRKIISRDNETIELYSFPCADNEFVSRFATVGLSSCHFKNAESCHSELMLIVPKEIALKQSEELSDYIFDVMAYILDTLGRTVSFEDLIPENPLAPEGWPKALLFDEPRGEPEELNCFQIGSQHVELLWLIPIFGSEYRLIKENGIGKFDEALESIELSLVDVRRDSCV